jgi:hypothetical protein
MPSLRERLAKQLEDERRAREQREAIQLRNRIEARTKTVREYLTIFIPNADIQLVIENLKRSPAFQNMLANPSMSEAATVKDFDFAYEGYIFRLSMDGWMFGTPRYRLLAKTKSGTFREFSNFSELAHLDLAPLGG